MHMILCITRTTTNSSHSIIRRVGVRNTWRCMIGEDEGNVGCKCLERGEGVNQVFLERADNFEGLKFVNKINGKW